MSTVVCFGEIMLRLAPPGYLRFEQAAALEVVYGGGEANVCVALANFELPYVCFMLLEVIKLQQKSVLKNKTNAS